MNRSLVRPAGSILCWVLLLSGVLLFDTASLQAETGPATAEEAKAFVQEGDEQLLEAIINGERASWVYSTYINHDTELLSAKAEEALIKTRVALAKGAARFDKVAVSPEVRRKLNLFKTALTLPAPDNAQATAELTGITTSLGSRYGSGKYCRPGSEDGKAEDGQEDCIDLTAMGRVMATSRDAAEQLELWQGWREVAAPMREEYRRFVELGNEGAQGLGYSDLGALWRSQYDMDPDAFAAELDRLWGQVEPLYKALHCHVRARLAETYGEDAVPAGKPLPAHLLGNMWAQTWSNSYDLVAPASGGEGGFDLTERLETQKVDEIQMVRFGEGFFSSLGLDPLPETFWERSLFVQPKDRDVVCHASAWDVDQVDDLRIKMCIQITGEDFGVIHHELGHNYYQRAYNHLPMVYRNSANDGFHEALGDTVALSITPRYLVKVGLLDEEPDPSADLGILLRMALDKVAFLPFGLMVDQWRWKVFSGEISPENYNAGWWELRKKYQGVAPPVDRSEADFDPGAKYHVPFNVPYTRYFLAHILQFQFHRGLCEIAGIEGPLHRCSIYGNKKAGERLEAMMKMGLSKPWPDALEALTGERSMDASAVLEYFAPLQAWLDDQNEGRTCGW